MIKYELVSNEPIDNFSEVILPNDGAITDAHENLVQDPEDLTLWTASNVIVSESAQTINGHVFWELRDNGAGANVQKRLTINNTNAIARVIVRKGSVGESIATIYLRDLTLTEDRAKLTYKWNPDFSYSLTSGELISIVDIDDDTKLITIASSAIVSGNTHFFALFPPIDTGSYIYVCEPQVTEGTTMYPFVNGTKYADVVTADFAMPDRFTFDIIVEPLFAYDDTSNRYLFDFSIDVSNSMFVYYRAVDAKFWVWWKQDGNLSVLASQTFDDGSSFTNINQRIRFIGSIDLISGDISGSRFIVIPLNTGGIFEDSRWNTTPQVKNKEYTPLTVGSAFVHTNQADAKYEYLRTYDGLLVGDVNSNSDADELLYSKDLLFQAAPEPRENTYDLNGSLIPTVARGSFSQGSDRLSFENKLIERSFLSGATKVGEARIMSKDFTFFQSYAFTGDETFDQYFNTVISKWRGASKIRDATNGKETAITLMDFELPNDAGSFKRSGEFSVKLKGLNGFWEDTTPITYTYFLYAGTNKIAIENSGFMKTYPKLTFDVPSACSQLDVYIDETKEGLQLIDPTLGTATLNELVIDCKAGVLTIAGFDRTQNISDRTGYFPLPIGHSTLVVETPVDCKVVIEYSRRYFV